MTHTTQTPPRHAYSVDTIERWLQSADATTAFVQWAGRDATIAERCQAQLALLGWMPTTAADDFDTASSWIAEQPADSSAARQLRRAMFDAWVGTMHEHDAFHRAHPAGICSGCWL